MIKIRSRTPDFANSPKIAIKIVFANKKITLNIISTDLFNLFNVILCLKSLRAALSQAIEGRNETVPYVNKLMTYHIVWQAIIIKISLK